MPKLTPETQTARREHILDAAERCFGQSGFHRTTMQDICREAGVSAGALYVYFDSKEELIAGIAERDRKKLSEQFAALASEPDLTAALGRLGEHYAVDEPQHKRRMCVEIGLEATRNAAVGEIHRAFDKFAHDSLAGLFKRAADEGRIRPELDTETLARVIILLGDGMFWRRAVDPDFDARNLMPAIVAIVGGLLNQPADRSVPAPSATAGRPAEVEAR